MQKRPFVPVALAFIPGIHLAQQVHLPVSTGMFATAGLLLLALLIQRFRVVATICILLAVLSLGLIAHRIEHIAVRPPAVAALLPYQKVDAIARVTSAPQLRSGRVQMRAQILAMRNGTTVQPAVFRVRVVARSLPFPVRINDEIFLRADWQPPRGPRNPGEFDALEWFAVQGLAGTLHLREGGVLQKIGSAREPALPITTWTNHVRDHMRAVLQDLLPPATAAVVTGLMLGERSEIDDQTLDDFKRAGIIHVLAVSGLHAGFIMMLVYIAGSFFALPRSTLLLLSLLGVWAFALLTGMKPPVFRASLMASLFVLAAVGDKNADALNLLAFAALGILLLRPGDLYGTGFQLSFAAVAGIVMIHPVLERLLKKICVVKRLYAYTLPRWIISLMLVSLSAQMGTLPVSAVHFGSFSLVGMLSNLFAIPLVFVAVATAFLALLSYAILPVLAVPFAAAVHVVITLVLVLAELMARVPYAAVTDWYPAPVFVLVYGLALALLLVQATHARFWCVAGILFVLNYWAWVPVVNGEARLLRITCLDVGQGDAALVQAPNGRTLLIDAGPAFEDFSAGERLILPFLRRQGIHRLDAVLVTHPHLDHFGGLFAIAGGIPIGKVILADTAYASSSFRKLLSLLNFRNVPIQIARQGDVLDDFMPVLGLVFGPPADLAGLKKHVNNASIVLGLYYGKTSFLFTGDAEKIAEARLLAYGMLLRADVLKVGHHGSRSSSTPLFLQQVRPAYALFSAGAFNKYGHPEATVLSRFQQFGAEMHRTDLRGAAVYISDGRSILRGVE